MKLKYFFYVVILLSIFANTNYCQIQDWLKLVPLKSSRAEVEKLIGKPKRYFKSYGFYSTSVGEFLVWYSLGGCRKKVEGRQWNIPAQRLTAVILSTNNALPLESYISNKNEYRKMKVDGSAMDRRTFYISPDESITYTTLMNGDNTEFVESIELQPSKDKNYLLCKK